MKQKMVIQVRMNGDKSRSKALQIVVSSYGVTSASLGEKDKSQLEVIGEGVDPVKLTSSLRKKLAKWPHFTCFMLPNNEAYAEIISVNEVKEDKKEEPKKEDPPKVNPIVWSYGSSNMPPVIYQEVIRDHDPYCSIM